MAEKLLTTDLGAVFCSSPTRPVYEVSRFVRWQVWVVSAVHETLSLLIAALAAVPYELERQTRCQLLGHHHHL